MNTIGAAEALERQIQTIGVLSYRVKQDLQAIRGFTPEQAKGAATQWSEDLEILKLCKPMFWTQETSAAVDAIRIPIHEVTCSRELLYNDYAFCWFDKPWLTFNTPSPRPVNAIVWAVIVRMPENVPALQVTAYSSMTGTPFGRHEFPFYHTTCNLGAPLDSHVVPDVVDRQSGGRNNVIKGNPETALTLWSFVVSAGMFLRQKLAVLDEQPLNRPARRRLAATGWAGESDVSVVLLRERERRVVVAGEGERHYDDWQWLVTGHVRQQYYPSLDKHLPVLISPYIKGPEGKPMKPRTTPIYLVNR